MQVEEVEKENGQRSGWEVRAKHRKKVKPTIRDDHLATHTDFLSREKDMAKPIDDEGNQEALSVLNNRLVLTNEEQMGMQKEAEIIDVKYRFVL